MAKNNESRIPTIAILIGLIIGAMIMFFIYPSINPTKATTAPIVINDARALEVEGVLIFIKSEPKAPKTVLGILTQEKVIEIINKIDGIANDGHKTFVDKLVGGMSEVWENTNFQERIKTFIKAAKNKYPKVQGISI